MGWSHLVDKDGNIIGAVGDDGWDASEDYIIELLKCNPRLTMKQAIAYSITPNLEYLSPKIASVVVAYRERMIAAYKRSPSIEEVTESIDFVFRSVREEYYEHNK